LFALVLGACKVDTTVQVNVREDGSGVVRVVVRADAEAVTAAESGGVPIDQAVRLTDITDAGFDVGTWTKAEDGSATVVISRAFSSVSEVEGIVRALNGANGPLPKLRASRERGIYATDYGVTGRIDLDQVTTGVGDDSELLTRLQALGVDVAAIDAQLLAQIRSSFALKVVIRLPGQKPVTFTPKEGATTATVDASTQILDTQRIIFFGAAVGFLLLAVVFWFRGGRRRRRRRAPARRSVEPAAASSAPARRPPPRGTPPGQRARGRSPGASRPPGRPGRPAPPGQLDPPGRGLPPGRPGPAPGPPRRRPPGPPSGPRPPDRPPRPR
jgi:hypothetical protein